MGNSALLTPQYETGTWFLVHAEHGDYHVPSYAYGDSPTARDFQDHCGSPYLSHEVVEGVGVRMVDQDGEDQSDWVVFATLEEAKQSTNWPLPSYYTGPILSS
jgi:hypothetical protein